MAEAVVDGAPRSRFFCHKCSIEIERLLPDYTCPRCASGFIEELNSGGNDSGSGMDISSEDLSDVDPVSDNALTDRYAIEQEILSAMLGFYTRRRRPSAPSRNIARVNSDRLRQEMIQVVLENFPHPYTLGISEGGLLGQPVAQGGQHSVLFLGNPGDYVWGRDGLDAIVTQLLNQMDGAGPPPLPRKQIDEIPTATVTQSQVDSKLQCSVCWEDFKLSEPVRQLPCQHLYHAPCIVPWLELHGTCPICRQSLGDTSSAEANQDTVGPSLAALFRAANESNNSRTSSTSSSAGDTSSNNPTSEI